MKQRRPKRDRSIKGFVKIYKRICQEHFSPFAGNAGLVRGIQPLSPWKTLVWCPAPGLFHRSSSIFFSSDDADQFRNVSSRPVVWWQPWIYLRLLAYSFFGLSEGA